jgi:hypothetical protein
MKSSGTKFTMKRRRMETVKQNFAKNEISNLSVLSPKWKLILVQIYSTAQRQK